MRIETLEQALERIGQLEAEVSRLNGEIEQLRARRMGGRRRHDETWMTSYNYFISKYESGMSISEIVADGRISRRTAYRYLEYYRTLKKEGK